MSVQLEMVSDLVCPWCWLGLRRVQAAIASLEGEIEVELRFRPYQLDPAVPENGMPYKQYMAAKFGGTGETEANERKDRFSHMREALEAYGAEEDIPFKFSGIDVRPNTSKAHRLVRWAQGQGLGEAAKETIFHAYFHDHLDIGQENILIDLSEKIGLDPEIVGKLFESGADIESTAREESFFRELGIGGVPTYIADRKFAIQGAETPEKIAKLIRAAEAAAPTERSLL